MQIFDCHRWLGGSIVPGISLSSATVLEELQRDDADRGVLLSAHAHMVDSLAGNRLLHATVEHSPRLYGCLVAHINRTESSVSAMREMMPSRRFLGVAVLGRSLEEPVDEAAAHEILNAYRRYTKPIFLAAYNRASVETGLAIARKYPMLRVVLLGMGGQDWQTAIRAAHSATNIVLETSGALDRSKLLQAVETLGAHRIVFGSGFPGTCLPAALGMLQDAALSDEARRRILWDNAIRLFDLDT